MNEFFVNFLSTPTPKKLDILFVCIKEKLGCMFCVNFLLIVGNPNPSDIFFVEYSCLCCIFYFNVSLPQLFFGVFLFCILRSKYQNKKKLIFQCSSSSSYCSGRQFAYEAPPPTPTPTPKSSVSQPLSSHRVPQPSSRLPARIGG